MKTKHTTSRRITTRLAATLTASMMVAQAQQGPEQRDNDPNVRRPAGIPREMPRRDRQERQTIDPATGTIEVPLENRSINGSGNNVANPTWGQAEHPVIRILGNDYADGANEPAGEDRPSARVISNALVAQTDSILNRKGATDFLWQWGQFVDHDIIETPTVSPAEEFDITVPTGDPWFDPSGTGEQTIPLNRSLYEEVDGVREQINAITAYIDASMVYGSDEERAFALRRLDGTGKLKTTDSEQGDLLPYNDDALANAPSSSPVFFLAGDVRANEQLGLTALHTLFVREHNHWAEQYVGMNPQAMDEEIYQFARTIVAAEIQAITYREFLPLLLGPHAIRPYQGYRDDVRADISNSFGAAAYRIGHSLLSPELQRLDADGNEVEDGHLPLASAFFNPALIEEGGIDSVLRGLAAQQCQELDEKLVDDVRNFLFGPPGSGGFDLASLNIQRGRDHGIPGYNQARQAFGLRPLRDFRQLTRDPATIEALEDTYGNVDSMDLWVAGLCANDVPESMVGEVYQRILVDQFTRLRDGDRFFYLHALPQELVRMVEEQTLSEIIRRNTNIGEELPDNVFVLGRQQRLRNAQRGQTPTQRGTRR
ncbi:MAG: peroxidase family protein [Verrucomicrobiaceae bacterium]